MMKFLLLCCIGIMQPQPIASVSRSDSVMKSQADAFIASTPADLQSRQCSAVVSAIEGDPAPLERVRKSRNTSPQYSQSLNVRDFGNYRLYEPVSTEGESLPLLIYLHGGGWTFGSLNSCAAFCDAVASSGMIKVLAVDYRLAPEHPYPCALDDCKEAIRYAVGHCRELGIDPERITIGGDSSGGNLAIATALSCEINVSSLLLFYPVTKAYNDGSHSWKKYAEGYGLDSDLMEAFNRAYLPDGQDPDKLASVGDAPDALLERLPRTLLVAAGRDILCDQGREFAARNQERVTRVEFSDAVHLFITVPGQMAAFSEAVRLTIGFITGK